MVVGPIEWMDRDTMVRSNVFKISQSVYGTDTGYIGLKNSARRVGSGSQCLDV